MPRRRKLTREMSVKSLSPRFEHFLCINLDPEYRWKDFVMHITDESEEEIFSTYDIKNFELELVKGRSPTAAVLTAWSYKCPTILDLLHTLVRAERFDILKHFIVNGLEEMTDDEFDKLDQNSWGEYLRGNSNGKHDQNTVEESTIVHKESEAAENNCINEETTREVDFFLPQFSNEPVEFCYKDLKYLTDNFNPESLCDGGRLLGKGGYGEVFLCKSPRSADMAVKKLKQKTGAEQQFMKEIDTLSRFVHPNIVKLIGVSKDGPTCCIVYEYMENGSLADRLMCKDGTACLDGKQRCRIAKGIAEGLDFLHTSQGTPHIHRDIKTPNILLDYDFSTKISDCGLVHIGPTNPEDTHIMTTTIIGTTAYMPPEYFQGEISVKLDAYSFGVIILEILTGMPSYDESRAVKNLVGYVKEVCHSNPAEKFLELLDSQMHDWDNRIANVVFSMAKSLTNAEKNNRPTVSDVLDEIRNWPIDWQHSH